MSFRFYLVNNDPQVNKRWKFSLYIIFHINDYKYKTWLSWGVEIHIYICRIEIDFLFEIPVEFDSRWNFFPRFWEHLWVCDISRTRLGKSFFVEIDFSWFLSIRNDQIAANLVLIIHKYYIIFSRFLRQFSFQKSREIQIFPYLVFFCRIKKKFIENIQNLEILRTLNFNFRRKIKKRKNCKKKNFSKESLERIEFKKKIYSSYYISYYPLNNRDLVRNLKQTRASPRFTIVNAPHVASSQSSNFRP